MTYQIIAVFSRMRGNKILERLTIQDCNTPHSCDYRYIIPNSVQKQIKKLSRTIQDDIFECLVKMQTNPRPNGYLKMKNTEGYRIRIGDYRILYDIDDQARKVKLRKIGHRRDIYK